MTKMSKASGSAPKKPSEVPKRLGYQVKAGTFLFNGLKYQTGDTLDVDEGTARKIISDNPGVKLDASAEHDG